MEGNSGQVGRPVTTRGSRIAQLGLATGLLAGGVLAAPGCGWRPGADGERGPTPADRAAINRLDGEFVAAYGEGNAERIAALFAGDAVLVPPVGPACEGRDCIADYFDELLREEPATAEFDVQETKVLDGWAFERIDVTLYWNDPESGEELETWERYFWVLQRQADGVWKIARLVINAEDPGGIEDDEPGDGRRT